MCPLCPGVRAVRGRPVCDIRPHEPQYRLVLTPGSVPWLMETSVESAWCSVPQPGTTSTTYLRKSSYHQIYDRFVLLHRTTDHLPGQYSTVKKDKSSFPLG